MNGPERRDADFSPHEFAERINGELVGAYGNFINRTLAFLQKYGEGKVPDAAIDPEVWRQIEAIFPLAGEQIEKGRIKDALNALMELTRFGNRYFDAGKPWMTRTESPDGCAKTLFNCIQLIGNLAVLLRPFLPFSSDRVIGWLGLQKPGNRRASQGDSNCRRRGFCFSGLSRNRIKQNPTKTIRLGSVNKILYMIFFSPLRRHPASPLKMRFRIGVCKRPLLIAEFV